MCSGKIRTLTQNVLATHYSQGRILQAGSRRRNIFNAKGGSLTGTEQKASHEQGDGQKNFSEESKNDLLFVSKLLL